MVGITTTEMWTGCQTLVEYCSRSGRASGGRWSGQGHGEQSGSTLGGRKLVIAPVCFLQIRNFLKAHWEPRAWIWAEPRDRGPRRIRVTSLKGFLPCSFRSEMKHIGVSEIDHVEEKSTNSIYLQGKMMICSVEILTTDMSRSFRTSGNTSAHKDYKMFCLT